MTDCLHFFVPGLPIPKARARVVDGRAYTPDRTAAWEQRVAWAFKQAFPGHEPWGRDVCVGIEVEVLVLGRGERARIRGDTDNYLKAILDAIQGLAFEDDAQVVELHASKRRAGPGETPGVFVKLWQIQEGRGQS